MRVAYLPKVRDALQRGLCSHPTLLERQDAFLLGIYRTNRLIARQLGVEESALPPDYEDLNGAYLLDMEYIREIEREEYEARKRAGR